MIFSGSPFNINYMRISSDFLLSTSHDDIKLCKYTTPTIYVYFNGVFSVVKATRKTNRMFYFDTEFGTLNEGRLFGAILFMAF